MIRKPAVKWKIEIKVVVRRQKEKERIECYNTIHKTQIDNDNHNITTTDTCMHSEKIREKGKI